MRHGQRLLKLEWCLKFIHSGPF